MRLVDELHDARVALGLGGALIVYACWTIGRRLLRNRQTSETTRAMLIATDAGSRAENMRRGEFMIP